MVRKNLWLFLLLTFSLTGIALGVWGFCKLGCHWTNSVYETIRLFVINPSSLLDNGISWQLQGARWLIFTAFVLFTFKLFFEILAPKFITEQTIKLFYRNHIIICGLNQITINIIEKFENEKIIVLTQEENLYAETLKAKGKKMIIGDFTDENFWKKAKLKNASQLYAVIDNDELNLKAIWSAFSYLESNKNRSKALRSFVLIKDRELKNILEETTLFQYKTNVFDGSIFNINEMGIKYGIAMNMDKILPQKMETAPKILLVGLTERTEIVLLNLAHCFTMNRENFHFTIVEKETEKIRSFQKKYAYLCGEKNDFVKIDFVAEIKPENQDSIIVCTENQLDAIKQAVQIRYMLGENKPDILVFCNHSDTFSEVLEKETHALKDKNITLIDLFAEIINYVFDLEKEKSRKIEEKAKEAHCFWSAIYQMNKEWDALSGHFKQSNRNQILDNHLKAYIALGQRFEDIKNCLISFSDNDKETLAIMEHRRWMLEKYENGWTLAPRNNEFKRHDCLIPWEDLSKEQKSKDYNAIDLMIRLLNNPPK